jgi:hypothetical protein
MDSKTEICSDEEILAALGGPFTGFAPAEICPNCASVQFRSGGFIGGRYPDNQGVPSGMIRCSGCGMFFTEEQLTGERNTS